MNQAAAHHPWIAALQEALDGLERALLQNDAGGVEQASAQVQGVLQRAPKTAEFAVAGSRLRLDMEHCAQRFGQLRQAVLRTAAHSQRAVQSLIPQKTPATYGPATGRASGLNGSTGGAGRAYLSA
jgi:hypothetical protein